MTYLINDVPLFFITTGYFQDKIQWFKEQIEAAENSGEKYEKIYYLASIQDDMIDSILTFGSKDHCQTMSNEVSQ